MPESQRQIVERLLLARGSGGLTAYEAIYDHGITRLASLIYRLRREGWPIATYTAPGETARYWLTAAPPGRHDDWRQETIWKL